MELWIAVISAAVAAVAILVGVWQVIRLLRRLHAVLEKTEASAQRSLLQLEELLKESRLVMAPAQDIANEARRQLLQLAPLAESAGKLHGAADSAHAAARKLADAAADTAEAASARMQEAAGKYRGQIDQAIGFAEAALEGWLFLRSRKEKLRSSACSARDKGNPNEEGSD